MVTGHFQGRSGWSHKLVSDGTLNVNPSASQLLAAFIQIIAALFFAVEHGATHYGGISGPDMLTYQMVLAAAAQAGGIWWVP